MSSLEGSKRELAARKLNSDGDSKEARLRLAAHLGGLQCVPLLLVNNPHGDLEALHLHHYSITDFEPLHAIKGHLVNPFLELPLLLLSQVKHETEQLLAACLQKKTTGADLRATAIVLRQFLTGKVSNEIHTLLDTFVCIAQISCLPEHKCTPRTVLQLYNLTWYHHELLQHLIPAPTILTRSKLFGSYLHDTSCHAAPQFELVSLRSCKTEFEERLLGQVNRVAECCSNRQPGNVLQQMFIRLQVLLSQGKIRVKQTKVSRAAKGLPPYNGTIIPKSFIRSRMRSWQVQLQRVAPYLYPKEKECGEHRPVMLIASLMGNSMLMLSLWAHVNCTTGQHLEGSWMP